MLKLQNSSEHTGSPASNICNNNISTVLIVSYFAERKRRQYKKTETKQIVKENLSSVFGTFCESPTEALWKARLFRVPEEVHKGLNATKDVHQKTWQRKEEKTRCFRFGLYIIASGK